MTDTHIPQNSSHITAGLKKSLAEIAAKIDDAEQNLPAWYELLSCMQRTLLHFEPSADLNAIKPRRQRTGCAGRLEVSGSVIGVLKGAVRALTTVEVAHQVALSNGAQVGTAEYATWEKRVRAALYNLKAKKLADVTTSGGGEKAWIRVPPKPG